MSANPSAGIEPDETAHKRTQWNCDAFCKHMATVETATDNGTLTALPSEDGETGDDGAEMAECDCDDLNNFSCLECVHTGRKELLA